MRLEVSQGHWKSQHSIELVDVLWQLYMALSRVVSEIFNVEKYLDLEVPVNQVH